MSDPENKVPDSPESVDLKQQCEDLRRQVNMLLLTFTVASFTLTAYLGLADIRAGKDLEIVRQQRNQLAERSKLEGTGVQAVLLRLGEYSQTHPDFAAILAKHGVTIVSNAPASTPPAAPKK